MELDLLKLDYTSKNIDKNFGLVYEKQDYFVLGYNINTKGKNKESYKKYDIYCSKCSKDVELYGNGVFTSSLGNLNNGWVICGCSRNTRYTEEQRHILTLRQCEKYNVGFVKILGNTYKDYVKNKLKINLVCPKHGEYYTSYNDFMSMSSKSGCKGCKKESIKKSHTLNFNENLIKIKNTGKFLEGTTFKPTSKYRNNSNTPGDIIWEYNCPKCSNDGYVKNGVCDGIFSSTVSDLKSGFRGCRCGETYRWTKEQYEYRIKKNNEDYKFIKWEESFRGDRTKFSIKHKVCGNILKTTPDNWIRSKSRCSNCKGKSSDQFYINLISDPDLNTPIAIKIGITKDYIKRLVKLNSKTCFNVSNTLTVKFSSYQECRDFENFIKNKYKLNYLSYRDIKDGYTETGCTSLLDSIYKDTLWSDYSEIINKVKWE